MGSKHSRQSKKQRASDVATTQYYELASFGHLLDPKADRRIASVDMRNSELKTPLFVASEERVAAILLERGADVHARSKTNETPLLAAARQDATAVLALLLYHGADVHAMNSSGVTALHEARSAKAVQILLERGADVNALDQHRCSPLFCAVQRGSLDATTALLDAGADVTHLNAFRESALLVASWQKQVVVLELLLERGAALTCSSSSGRSPLHAAVDADAIEVVRFLLDRDHPVDPVDWIGNTPLHAATSLNRLEVLRLLLERGASVHCDGAPAQGLLLIAARHGHLSVMAELLAHGAQFETTSRSPTNGSDKCASADVASPAQLVQVIMDNYATVAQGLGSQVLSVFDRWVTKMALLADETKEAKAASTRLVQRLQAILAQFRSGTIPTTEQNMTALAFMVLRPWQWMHAFAMKSVRERVAETATMFDAFADFHRALDAIQGWFTLCEGSVAGYRQQEGSLQFYSWSLTPELRRERDAFMASELRADAEGDHQVFWCRMHVVAIGLAHLHEHGCVHGTLASWNDYPLLVAPEMRHATATATSAADVYSFGRAMLLALTHGTPWKGVSDDVAQVLASAGRLPPRPESVESEQWQLIESMCASNPLKRPVLGDVLEQFAAFAASEQAPVS